MSVDRRSAAPPVGCNSRRASLRRCRRRCAGCRRRVYSFSPRRRADAAPGKFDVHAATDGRRRRSSGRPSEPKGTASRPRQEQFTPARPWAAMTGASAGDRIWAASAAGTPHASISSRFRSARSSRLSMSSARSRSTWCARSAEARNDTRSSGRPPLPPPPPPLFSRVFQASCPVVYG